MWRGAASGLAPLGGLAIVVMATLGLTVGARQALAGSGFFAQQEAALLVAAGGLILGIALYALLIVRALRRVAAWQRGGLRARAAGALWALGVGAFVVAAPLLLAALLPQHPAP